MLMPARFREPLFNVPEEDWRVLTMVRPSVLLVGHEALVSEFLDALFETFQAPVARWVDRDLDGPRKPCATLIVRDADRLDLDEQDRLDKWLSIGPMPQVISTASSPVLPLVEEGRFLAPLFYRLNVIYLEFGRAVP